jgi:ankyrin repeat protein
MTVIDHCHKATVLGNKISIRLLEFFSTSEHPPHGFEELAHEFLNVCRVMWAIEAGLKECNRTHQRLPANMSQELDKKFKTTQNEFQMLEQMLQRYMEYERRGAVGKFQRGWRNMFETNDIGKMRDALTKTKEALKIGALVFEWSFGDSKIDESVGIGYTGLAAALDAMDKAREKAHGGSPRRNPPSASPLQEQRESAPVERMAGLNIDRESRHDAASVRRSEITTARRGEAPPSHRESAVSSFRGDAASSHRGDVPSHRRDVTSSVYRGDAASSIHRGDAASSIHRPDAGSVRDPDSASLYRGHLSAEGHPPLPPLPRRMSSSNFTVASDPHHSPIQSSRSPTSTVATSIDARNDYLKLGHDSVINGSSETDLWGDGPVEVVRIKADPASMPHWASRSSTGGTTPALHAALVAAVEDQNHRMIEELLDRGVPPEGPEDNHMLREAIRNHDGESVRLLLLFGANPNNQGSFGVTPLYAAVAANYFDGATTLLKYGADPNAVTTSVPESPVAKSIQDDKPNLTVLLLKYGGDPNHVMSDGETILIRAIIKKRPKKLIDVLLDYGADPNGKDSEGASPLFGAINSSRIEVVVSLLDHGANPNLPGPKHMLWPAVHKPDILQLLLDRGADHKKTPGIVELSTSINNIESVRMLLKAGADPNCKKDGVWTPLCTSIRDNRADIFQLLIANGADPNLSSAEFPCFKCVTHNRLHFLQPLVDAGGNLSQPKGIIETAVQFGNVEAINWLLAAGVNPNDRVPVTGASALTTAIKNNKVDLFNILLAGGADPNARGEDWPICVAVRHPEMLKRLLPCLAEPRAFKGIMEMAVVANQLDSIKLLVAAGVSVEDRNGGVFSPLTTAIRERHKPIVYYLLNEAGADPNSPGEHLPIIKALRRMEGHDTELLGLLMDKGADPNKVYRGHNAIIQALENGDDFILKFIVDRCVVDVEAKDDQGRTVAQIANSRGSDMTWDILSSNKSAVNSPAL